MIVQTNSFNMLRGRMFVVGGGKAAGAMAEELESIIGPKNITCGIVNSVVKAKTKVIRVNKAGLRQENRLRVYCSMFAGC